MAVGHRASSVAVDVAVSDSNIPASNIDAPAGFILPQEHRYLYMACFERAGCVAQDVSSRAVHTSGTFLPWCDGYLGGGGAAGRRLDSRTATT